MRWYRGQRVLAVVLVCAAVPITLPVLTQPVLAQPVIMHADLAAFTSADQPGITFPDRLTSDQRALYAGIVGDQGDWAPRGEIIASSGFTPTRDGFRFLNYGDDLTLNQLFFKEPRPLARSGRPAEPVQLRSRDMRLVYGDAVCAGSTPPPSPDGPCRLTESAAEIRRLAMDWAKVGHCWAMTTAAAGLFNGWVSRGSYGAGAVTGQAGLNARMQRGLGRLVMAAYATTTGFLQPSATELVNSLRSALTPGRIQYSLLLVGPTGGHAVLPLAVLDRGNGLVDIAIYDPNVPGRERAIHVDTKTGTWEYQGSVTPVRNPILWSSAPGPNQAKILLGIIDNKFGTQVCNFCGVRSNHLSDDPGAASDQGSNRDDEPIRTLIRFSPVLRVNAAIFKDIVLSDLAGNPLDPTLYEVVPSLDALVAADASLPAPCCGLKPESVAAISPTGLPQALVGGPSVYVKAGVSFKVGFKGVGLVKPQAFTMSVIRPGDVRTVRLSKLLKGGDGIVEVDGLNPALRVSGRPLQRVRVSEALDAIDASYRFVAEQQVTDGVAALTLQVLPVEQYAIISGRRGEKAPFTIVLRSTAAGVSQFRASPVTIPPGAQLIVRYSAWQGDVGRPTLWLDRGSDGTPDVRLTLTRVS